MVCCEPFYWSFRRNNPVRGSFVSLSHTLSVLRSHLSLASTPWTKLHGPPPLSHPHFLRLAGSELQSGIHTGQWLGCHHSPLSRWPTMERGWAHLHRCVRVVWGKKKSTPTPCFFFLRSRDTYNSWCTPGGMQLQYSFFLCLFKRHRAFCTRV